MRHLLAILILTLGVAAATAAAIAAQPTAKSVPGKVVSIDAANNNLKLKTGGGETVVTIDAKTEVKKISPDKLSDPSLAIVAGFSDISVGDKVVAVGILSDDKKTMNSVRRIFLLTKADLAKKQESDNARWTTRGIAGRVTGLNPVANTITVAVRGGFGGERMLSVIAADKTIYHRYAPNSVKFSDAKTSHFSELKIGDQLRAVGDKSEDGTALTAEEILFGSFRMVAGKIIAIDAAKGEILVKDLQTNKNVTIAVNSDTLLRRFPAETAQRIAQIQAMRATAGAGGGGTTPGNGGGGQTLPRSNNPGQKPLGGGGGGLTTGMGGGGSGGQGGRRGDVDAMLEQMPELNLSELKIGDAVAASSSVGTAPDLVTAIKFVAGIEPFLSVPQTPNSPNGGNRPQSSPSINIPGLDGIGAP